MVIKNTALPKPRQAALTTIAERSCKLNQEWVTTEGIDPRPLNALEAMHLIVQMRSDDSRSARLTAAGWDAAGQPSPFRPASTTEPKPMEAETADARKPNGKILHSPYPDRSKLPPVKPLPAQRAPEPVPSEPAAPPPVVQAEPSAPAVEPPVGQIAADCPDCIFADILNVVAVMYPEIVETVDILTRAKHIERDLKARGNGRNPE